MSFYDSKDLARAFRTVRDNTIKIAEEIPEEQYSFRPAPGTRTVAETLAHLAVAPRWPQRLHSAGTTAIEFSMFPGVMERQMQEETALTTKAQILNALTNGGTEFVAWLGTLTDEALAEHVHFPAPIQPPSKSRFEMLLASKEHEMHHRGQLMLIERMIGIVPHLTREMEARRAQMQSQMATAKA